MQVSGDLDNRYVTSGNLDFAKFAIQLGGECDDKRTRAAV